MIGVGGDVVDADRVSAKSCHETCVGITLGYVCEGIGGGALVGNA